MSEPAPRIDMRIPYLLSCGYNLGYSGKFGKTWGAKVLNDEGKIDTIQAAWSWMGLLIGEKCDPFETIQSSKPKKGKKAKPAYKDFFLFKEGPDGEIYTPSLEKLYELGLEDVVELRIVLETVDPAQVKAAYMTAFLWMIGNESPNMKSLIGLRFKGPEMKVWIQGGEETIESVTKELGELYLKYNSEIEIKIDQKESKYQKRARRQ